MLAVVAMRVDALDGIEDFYRCVQALEPRASLHDDVWLSMHLQVICASPWLYIVLWARMLSRPHICRLMQTRACVCMCVYVRMCGGCMRSLRAPPYTAAAVWMHH